MSNRSPLYRADCLLRPLTLQNSHFVGQSGTFPQRFTQDIPVSASSERASLASTLASNALGSRSNSARLTNIYRLLGSLGSHDLSLMRDTLGGVPSRCMSAFASADGMFITAQFLYEAGPPSSSASAPARVSTTQTGDDETAREEGSPPASAFVATYTTGIHNVGIFDASVEVITDDRVIRIDYDTPYVKGLPITISVKENDKGAAGAGAGGSYSERIIRPTYLDAYSSQFALVANALRGTGPELKTTPKDAAEDLKIFKMIMDQL